MDVSGELSLSEYLAAMDRAIAQRAGRGTAALKLAIAYERGLDFMPADQRAAERGWSRRDASSAEMKAFEDMAAFYLCRMAGDLGIPVQIHTGMGNLERTRALWLKPRPWRRARGLGGTWEEEENSVNIHNKFRFRVENSNKNQKQLVEILLQRAVFCIFRRRIYTNCTEPAHGVFRLHTYLFVLIFKNLRPL